MLEKIMGPYVCRGKLRRSRGKMAFTTPIRPKPVENFLKNHPDPPFFVYHVLVMSQIKCQNAGTIRGPASGLQNSVEELYRPGFRTVHSDLNFEGRASKYGMGNEQGTIYNVIKYAWTQSVFLRVEGSVQFSVRCR